MEHCPNCKSRRVHQSRTRSAFERWRHTFTRKSPFRCSECGWRGWSSEFAVYGENFHEFGLQEREPDLTALDKATEHRPAITEKGELDV